MCKCPNFRHLQRFYEIIVYRANVSFYEIALKLSRNKIFNKYRISYYEFLESYHLNWTFLYIVVVSIEYYSCARIKFFDLYQEIRKN